jgi:hypothetical protein
MARTAIPLSTFTSLADLNDAGTAIDQANGMTIALGDAIPANGGIERLVIYVQNTHAATHTVTIRAGTTNPPAFEGGEGDLTTGNLTASTGTAFIAGLHSSRFAQSDGSVSVDFSASITGTIWAFLLPK